MRLCCLPLPTPAFAIDAHPTKPVFAVGLLSGQVRLYASSHSAEKDTHPPSKTRGARAHNGAARTVKFKETQLFSAGSDAALIRRDVETFKVNWRRSKTHKTNINVVELLDEAGIASGDDDGIVHMWDLRDKKPALTFHEHMDMISGLFFHEQECQLAASSSDGMVSVYDLRRGRLFARSDDLEDCVNCLAPAKKAKKLLCGMNEGVIGIFSWGNFGDYTDRCTDHPDAVESMANLNDDIVLTGCADGLIRALRIHPNKVLGVVGQHADAVLNMCVSNEDILYTTGADGMVQLWDISALRTSEDASSENSENSDSDREQDPIQVKKMRLVQQGKKPNSAIKSLDFLQGMA